ncbi:MAG: hypothetical protein JXB26_06915 [Candidatus Aminicenantes bacterium]|nr:hypothetical protein [Candidatus Aminicenantes bacterium]
MTCFKIRKLCFLGCGLVLFFIPSLVFGYTVSGTVTCDPTGWVPIGAKVEVYDIDPLPGNTYHVDPFPLAVSYVDSSGNYTLTFTWPTGGPDFEMGGPDLIFKVIQNIGGSNVIIYEEVPSDVHWNVNDGDTVDLTSTSSQAVCVDPNQASIPTNNDFLFTRIGKCEVAYLSKGMNDPDTLGYFRALADGYTSVDGTGVDTDQPWGSNLEVFGWIGLAADATCYQVHYRYSTNNGSTWSSWIEVDSNLSSKWYDTTNYVWVAEKIGPFSPGPAGSPTNLYKIPFKIDINKTWSYIDRIALFNTLDVPDGLCELKVEGFNWDYDMSSAAATATNLDNDLPDSQIVLRIDNSPPTVKILGVELDGVDKEVCEILNLGTGSSNNISVDFRVYDLKGHLGSYVLDAQYGHRCSVRPRPEPPDSPNNASDNYENNTAANPVWNGSMSYTAKYLGSFYGTGLPDPTVDCYSLSYDQMPANVMPSCAYQFRLWATKRTTNGYGLIYTHVEDTWHVTIER